MNDNLYDSPLSNQPISESIESTNNGLSRFWSFFGDANVTASIIVLTTTVPILIGFGLWLIKYYRFRNYRLKKLSDWENTAFLEISVPKETNEQAQKETNKKDEKEVLAIGEQLYSIMSEYAKSNFDTWLYGGERFSLEIIAIDKEIRFWLACSKDIAEVLEKQIVAIYSKAHIQRFKKLDFFKENTVPYVQELTLSNRYELPFKTYKLTDHDPLNTITSAMTGLDAGESAAIQLVLVPIKDSWQSTPRTLALKIQQGLSPKEVLTSEFSLMKEVNKILGSIFKEIFRQFGQKTEDDKPKPTEKERKIDLSGKEQQISLTPQQLEIIKKLEEKASRPGFTFALRIVGSSSKEARSKQIVDGIMPAFQVFDIKPFNGFKRKATKLNESLLNFLMRASNFDQTQILNTEEINSIWHLPNYLTQTPNIKWLLGRRPPIPLDIPDEGPGNVYIGVSTSRGQTKDIYLKTEDRYRHIYSLGGSGSGKSVTMNSIALQDIKNGNGVCLVDPHGEGVDDILRRIPEERIKDVIVFSPSITDRPLGLNMLETDPKKPTQKTLVIDTLFTIWDKLYDLKKTGGPMFENYMKNSMRLVMSHPESGSTLMEISKVLSDEDFRSFKLAMCDEPEVVDFWEKEATKAGGEASLENMVPYITSKLAPFVTNDFLRPMIGQQKSCINWREAMDNKKIVLVSLSKGSIGESSAYLIGMVIIGGILMAGMGRNDGLKYNLDGTTTEITPGERTPFFVYIDEMQNFLFDAIPKALEEIRKYKVGFYLAHQFVKQVIVDGNERIKDSIMANCASKFIFRCSADDAKYLESEFYPLSVQDIANPEARSFNSICLVNGQRTSPFNISAKYDAYMSLESDPMAMKKGEEQRKRIMEMVKQKYGRPKEEVEQEIRDRAKLLF